jgi:ATP/ADP translocase
MEDDMTTTEQSGRTRPAGTAVERRGWVLLALLTGVMVVFGFEAYFSQESASTVIYGSGCCNGHRLSEAPGWVYDYSAELSKYLGTYMVGTGIFGLAVVWAGLRSARRWAWLVSWYVPVLFAVHGFALGSFPFDIATLALSVVGLLLMVRPVFGDRTPQDPPAEPATALAPSGSGGHAGP